MSETYSLFKDAGLKTVDEMRQARRDRMGAFMRAQQDPFSKAGAAIGLGLSGLFGPSEEMQRAMAVEEAITAGDNSSQITQAMSAGTSLLQSEDPETRAIGARLLAMGQAQQTKRFEELRTQQRQYQEEQRNIADFERDRYQQYQETRRVQVGTDPITGAPVMGSQTFTFLRDKDNPDAEPRLLSVSDDAPAPAGGSVDPNAPVPVTGPIVRAHNGTRLEKAPDGNYYQVVTGTDGEFRGGLVTNPRLVEEESATGGRGNVVGATPSTRGQMGRNNPARTVTAPQQTNIPSGQARLQRRAQ